MMRNYSVLLVTLVAFQATQAVKIRVGAWNVENLGVTKMGKEWFMRGLAKVVATYDVIFLQEIEMSRLDTREEFINMLQDLLQGQYKVELWGSGDEHYGLAYKIEVLKVTAQEDEEKNVHTPYEVTFSRPPLVALIQPTMEPPTHGPFWLIGIHTKPSNAYEEITNLKAVYDWYQLSGDVLILGDLNYGYVSQYRAKTLKKVFQDFQDVIGSADTSTRKTDSSHDRILVTNTMFEDGEMRAVNGSVFRFDEDPQFQDLHLQNILNANGKLDVTNFLDDSDQLDAFKLLYTVSQLVEDANNLLAKECACAYSDHYPVEVEVMLRELPSKL